MPPPLPPPPLCTLPPGPGPPRFVCYCEGEGSGAGGRGGFNLYVTDAAELWSTCFTPDSLAALVGNGASGRPVAPSTPHGSAARLWDRRVWDPPPPEGSERPSHSSVALVPKSVPRGSGSGRFGVSPVVLGSQAPGDQSLCPVESPFWPECG